MQHFIILIDKYVGCMAGFALSLMHSAVVFFQEGDFLLEAKGKQNIRRKHSQRRTAIIYFF